jgi:hypothetical protein
VGLQNGTCPQDCPVAHMVCPGTSAEQCSARGRCYPNSGLCDCFVGCARPPSYTCAQPIGGALSEMAARVKCALNCAPEPALSAHPCEISLVICHSPRGQAGLWVQYVTEASFRTALGNTAMSTAVWAELCVFSCMQLCRRCM